MDGKEVRMRCIESITRSGVRSPQRVIQEAAKLETWVNAVEDKAKPLKRGPKKSEDNR